MLMPLAVMVADFVRRVGQSPKLGTDKAELETLMRAARHDHTGFFGALHAPIAPLRWQARVRMNGNVAQSNRQPIQLPRKMVVTAIFIGVTGVPNTNPNALVPTTNDFDVKIDINQKTQLTSNQGVSTSAATETDGNFVLAAPWSVQTPALVELKLRNPNPVIGFQARWIRVPSAVAGQEFFQDAIISFVIFARDYDSNISSNVGSEVEGV